MDFFERQDRARRNTTALVMYFGCGVVLLMLAVYLAVLALFAGFGHQRSRIHGYAYRPPSRISLWNPSLFLGASAGTLAVVLLGSLFKTAELSRGGKAVAEMLSGRPVSPITTYPDERKLLNVVEEMALASGVPVPQVYVLPEERGINAFAAGHSTSDAVIGVTQGAVRLLKRDELQGVIAHEFSHILNGDMRLNLRLMGLIFGILCLAVIGRVLLQVRAGRKNPLPILGLALLIIGWAGVFFGRLIQAAVSRQREFLADASAVQFTRNPEGLAGALKKIRGLSMGSKLNAAQAQQASHLFFGNGLGESFLHLWDTHPPLVDRIRAIDPSFDGSFPPVTLPEVSRAPQTPPRRPQRTPAVFPLAGSRAQTPAAGFAAPPVIAATAILPAIGSPTPANLRYADELQTAMPDMLRAAAREPLGACTIVYGLLLSWDEPTQKKQLQELSQATAPEICREAVRLLPAVQQVATHAKLPLVDLALEGLRMLSPAQFQQFRNAVQLLVESDSEIDLFEYVLQKIVIRHLEPQFLPARKPVVQYYSLKPLAGDCGVLLSGLARAGSEEPAKIASAFKQGASALAGLAQAGVPFVSEQECGLAQIDAALNRLSQATPVIKKSLIQACALTVAADGVIRETEAELLRAMADTLDCPIPPFERSQKPEVWRGKPANIREYGGDIAGIDAEP